MKFSLKSKIGTLCLVALFFLYAVVMVRTAWVSDDAYITFRTVYNFVNGYGLTYNTAERVQAYTNPLFMFLVSAFYLLTGEIYYTSICLCIAISLATVLLLAFKISRTVIGALLVITILIFSKAFIDYSTSGLENPLTHLIVAIFLFVYFKYDNSLKKLFLLSVIAAMGALNRMDTVLLFIPVIIYSFIKLPTLKGTGTIIIGFFPFILWECFSLFYYGFPFPNTAYAKLNTGIKHIDLAKQGIYYLANSLKMDPVTILVIVCSLVITLLKKEWSKISVSIGIVLYLIYIIFIGGDFMSGRFLTVPLLAAVIFISQINYSSRILYLISILSVVVVGLSSPYPPILSNVKFGSERTAGEKISAKGIADERGWYYQVTGLLKNLNEDTLNKHELVLAGLRARSKAPSVIAKKYIGFFGFYAGPQVHIVDFHALADPLLARLPAKNRDKWRIGHFVRSVPDGYIETLKTGQNKIKDMRLAQYYDKLSLITRGRLFDTKRIKEIWNINSGKYSNIIH